MLLKTLLVDFLNYYIFLDPCKHAVLAQTQNNIVNMIITFLANATIRYAPPLSILNLPFIYRFLLLATLLLNVHEYVHDFLCLFVCDTVIYANSVYMAAIISGS